MLEPESTPTQQPVVPSPSPMPLPVSFPMTGAQTHVPSCPLLPPGDPDTLDHIKKNQLPFLINVSSP